MRAYSELSCRNPANRLVFCRRRRDIDATLRRKFGAPNAFPIAWSYLEWFAEDMSASPHQKPCVQAAGGGNDVTRGRLITAPTWTGRGRWRPRSRPTLPTRSGGG